MNDWWGHLKLKVLAFGIVMSVLPLALFGWYGIMAARDAQAEIAQTRNQAAARLVADELAQFIKQLMLPIQLQARIFGADLVRLPEAERERVLYAVLRDVPYLDELAVADGAGAVLTRVSRREVTTGAPLGQALRWKAGDPALGDVSLDVDGRPLIDLGVPLPDGAGALVARASLRGVFANIAAVRGDGGIQIHVIDEAGRIIGDTDFSLVLSGTIATPPSDDGVPYRSITGEEVLGTSAPVPGLPWQVVGETTLAHAMGPVRHLGYEFGGAAAVLMILVVALSVVFGLQLTEPLERLEAGARQVGSGDLAARVAEGGRDELGRLIKSFNAMTEQLQAQSAALQRVRETEKLAAVGQLAAGVAHEINNPLAVISAYAEDLSDRLKEEGAASLEQSGDLQAYLIQLQGQVQRCKGITTNLLSFARRGPTEPEPVDTLAVARQTAALITPRAKKSGVTIQIDAPDHLPLVRATHDQLQQVFLNLMANALDAMDECGRGELRITAALLPAEGRVQVTVADDGPGMDPETLKRAMEPFFTTKPPGRGTGLGLSSCYGIITGLGGRMALESAPGRGARVSFELPLWEGYDAERVAAAGG